MVGLRPFPLRHLRALAFVAAIAGVSGCSAEEQTAVPTDGGDAVAYCSLAASIVGGIDEGEALLDMVSVAPPMIATATANAADGDRSDHARAVEAYVLDECGVVLTLGT